MIRDPALVLTPRPWIENPIDCVVFTAKLEGKAAYQLTAVWGDRTEYAFLLPTPSVIHSHEWKKEFADELRRHLEAVRDGTMTSERRYQGLARALPEALQQLAKTISRRTA